MNGDTERQNDLPDDYLPQIRRPASAVNRAPARPSAPTPSASPRRTSGLSASAAQRAGTSGARPAAARPLSQPAAPVKRTSPQPVHSAPGATRTSARRAVLQHGAADRPKSHPVQDANHRTRTVDRRQLAAAKQRSGQTTPPPTEEGSTVMSLIKAILYIVIVVAVSGLLSYYIIVFGNDMYAFVKSDEEVEVSIPAYATVEEIADVLGDAGVVKYPDLLVLYAKIKKIDKTYEFVAGDYTVNGMMNYDELFYAFVNKKSYETVRITIPEGYTVDEIIHLFLENGIGTREGFVDAINHYAFDFDFVRALDENLSPDRIYRLEGYLYPDTYDFYKSSSEVTVIYKLLNRFNTIFSSSFYDVATEKGYSVDEIITLASMIEKEGRYSQDYEIISSVFHNRLDDPANYPKLQSDATIMYAIQIRDGERKTSLSEEDLSYDTPYNSYLYNGLPPGPIANPGYEAITCALYPAKTKYRYFVSDSYGNTYYATSLAQHNENRRKVKQIDG